MKTKILLSLSTVLITLSAFALPPLTPIRSSDDRQLSRGTVRVLPVNEALVPDGIQTIGQHPSAQVQFVRLVKNKPTPVPALKFKTSLMTRAGQRQVELISDATGLITLPACEQSTLNLQSQFREQRYGISSRNKYYTLQTKVPCKAKTVVVFKEDSPAGQVIAIHQVIQRAIFALAQVSDFKFWDRHMRFIYPSDGDYYTNDQVNITLGHQWDVVGHEMGHAIYDQARIGVFGGGPHKIDECYSHAMALSEGWASYFSGWIHVDLKDADAKFEYLVPRRAPIRFEHVPSDVCGKSTNEWRVTSFFWDLVDLNADGEISQIATKKLWDDMLDAQATSVKNAAERLMSRGWDKNQVLQIWKLNFPLEAR